MIKGAHKCFNFLAWIVKFSVKIHSFMHARQNNKHYEVIIRSLDMRGMTYGV